jgi:G protein beta subunit-like protein
MINFLKKKGFCYVWTLRGGFNDRDEIKIIPRDKVFQPHQRYALKCLFSPDSTLVYLFYEKCIIY